MDSTSRFVLIWAVHFNGDAVKLPIYGHLKVVEIWSFLVSY